MSSGGIHLITGYALGTHFRRPHTAFVAGVCSHALLDMLPHHDYRSRSSQIADLSAGFLLLFALEALSNDPRRKIPAWAAAVGGLLPDVENVVAEFGLVRRGRLIFPTHGGGPLPHGRATRARTAAAYVLITLIASVAILRAGSRRPAS